MTYQLLKDYIDSKGIKQQKIVDILSELYPDECFSKNKLSNILLGKVELSAEDFKKIFLAIKSIFPDAQVNNFFDLNY